MVVMPASEAKLFASAEALMRDQRCLQEARSPGKVSDSPAVAISQGTHAVQAQEYLDVVDMQRIEDQARNRKGKPKTEGEKFLHAGGEVPEVWRPREGAGNLPEMIVLLQDQTEEGDAEKYRENKLWMRMAQKKVDEIKAEGARCSIPSRSFATSCGKPTSISATTNVLKHENLGQHRRSVR